MAQEPYNFFKFRPIIPSEFMHMPPPNMGYGQGKENHKPTDLLYKILRGETKLIRSSCEANGFSYSESHEWNILWSSSSCKSYIYEGLNEYQKINHFPMSYEITRKDRMAVNIGALQNRHPGEVFDFIPETFVLPEQYGDFVQKFNKIKV